MKTNRIVSILLAVAMIFSMFAFAVSAEETAGFPDTKGHWAEEIIAEWADRGVVNGYPDGNYVPDGFLTRAEYAQIVKNLLALTEKADKDFKDVAASAWYYDAVMCAAKAEVMVGHNGSFRPDDHITREEALVAYARMLGIGNNGNDPDLSKFADGKDVSDWALERISGLVKEGVILGMPDGKLHPKDNITRAEFLAMLSQTKDADHKHSFVGEDGTCAICGKSEEQALKFYLGVTSNGATVDMSVYNDYSAVVTVPAKEVSAANVSVTAKMQNVATLGVDAAREHTVEIKDTGLVGTPNLADWLSNAFTFESGYVQATIDGTTCLYHVTGDKNAELATLRADSDDICATRDAWQKLTANVSTSSQEESDSYINIACGSFLNIAGESLCFEKEEDLKLDNFNDIAALNKSIREHVTLKAVDGDLDWQIIAVLKAGTALAVSNSIATLDKDATIKVKGLSAKSLAELLPALRDAESAYEIASLLVKAVNDVIGAADGTTADAPVTVDISFAAAQPK